MVGIRVAPNGFGTDRPFINGVDSSIVRVGNQRYPGQYTVIIDPAIGGYGDSGKTGSVFSMVMLASAASSL